MDNIYSGKNNLKYEATNRKNSKSLMLHIEKNWRVCIELNQMKPKQISKWDITRK